MKDSQPFLGGVWSVVKYIKESNERFSTHFQRVGSGS